MSLNKNKINAIVQNILEVDIFYFIEIKKINYKYFFFDFPVT